MKKPMRWFALFVATIMAGAVAAMAAGETLPGQTGDSPIFADIVLVLDNSGSMKANDPEFLTRDVVIGFLDGFHGKGRIGMVVFDQDVRLTMPLSDMTHIKTRANLLESLERIDYTGRYSDSPAAVERAIYELKTRGRDDADHVIILLTDGIVDTGDRARDIERSRWLKEDLTRESEYAGIRVFGIAFTDRADFSLIQTLAMKTAGAYFRAFSAADIQVIFEKIRRTIQTPPPQEKPTASAPRQPVQKGVSPSAVVAVETPAPDRRPAQSAEPSAPAQQPRPTGAVAARAPSAPPADAAEAPVKQAWLLPAILVAILILLGLIIAIQLTGRRHEPERAVSGTAVPAARPLGRKPPGQPRAELLDLHRITGVRTLPIDRQLIRVGRDRSNELVIAKDTVSSLHALIEYRDGFFYLEDQKSKNKTRLNGLEIAPYAPRKLKSGDEISFNRFKFKFMLPDIIPAGQTVVDYSGKQNVSNDAPAAESVPESVGDDPKDMPKAMLIDVENITGKKTVDLEKPLTTVGRGVHNTIVIDADSISGSHATIEYRSGSFFLEDQRSTNKTRLNNEQIGPHQPEKLKSGDEIMFDAYKFIFLLERQTPAGDTNESW